ncbi:DUF4215 domain-containing protein [Nannocystis pusilla]|uniref:DUF4215 domain-containing protein n=1 Tax=Nannocystis pusilla TaxID=889268 RepID=UPI003DA2A7CD
MSCSTEQVGTTDAGNSSTTGATSTDGTTGGSTTSPAPTTGPSPTTSSSTGGETTIEPGTTTTGSTTTTTTTSTTEPAGPECGDGKLDPGEECDGGGNNGPNKPCSAECKVNVCGDGDQGPNEGCDDGNLAGGDGCSADCTLESCGDGELQAGEECDDGDQDNGDECTVQCQFPACGDGHVQPDLGEVCDDGDADEKDECTSLCQFPACGDGIVHDDEECDDGDDDDDDGCPGTCKYATCGDGFVHAGVEECDDANNVAGDGCEPDCKASACGDGVLQAGVEECDDGNNVADDGCDPSCEFSVVQLASAEGTTCARFGSGKLRCWGSNMDGQLGLGHTNHLGDAPNELPSPFVDLGDAVLDVVAGHSSFCAIVTGGKVRCWGSASQGVLGYGDGNNIGDQPGEMPPPNVDLGGPVVKLASGSSHMCALSGAGEVRCWGNNSYGALGYGHTNNIGDQPGEMPPPAVALGGPVVALGSGGAHSCAIMAQGQLRCWGNNTSGQLGYGHTNHLGDQPGEMPPPVVNVGGPVAQVGTGYVFTCAVLANTKMRCWGDNKYKQVKPNNVVTLKIGDQPGEMPPADFGTKADIVWEEVHGDLAIACARSYNPNVPGHSVRCWGDPNNNPNLLKEFIGGGIFDPGYSHACGRHRDGPNVYCWGANGYGVIGLGQSGGTSGPKKVTVF